MQVFCGALTKNRAKRRGWWAWFLLLLTLAYGLTGYLLPWDNRAYWGTVVTTQIAATARRGPLCQLRLLGSDGGDIGVVTFARFYALARAAAAAGDDAADRAARLPGAPARRHADARR
jgi:quinol-cytochrome oxidoreductase complex cytochrome b subunit